MGTSISNLPFGTREADSTVITRRIPNSAICSPASQRRGPAIMREEMRKGSLRERNIDGILITCRCQAAGERKPAAAVCAYLLRDYPEILELMKEDVVTLTWAKRFEWPGKEAWKSCWTSLSMTGILIGSICIRRSMWWWRKVYDRVRKKQ